MIRNGCHRTGKILVLVRTVRCRQCQWNAGNLQRASRWSASHSHSLAGCEFKDVATDNQGRIGEERVNHCGGCVWHQHHVGFVNAFPAANRGAVKHFAFFEEFSIHLMSRDSDVLFFTFGIGGSANQQTSLRARSASSSTCSADIL